MSDQVRAARPRCTRFSTLCVGVCESKTRTPFSSTQVDTTLLRASLCARTQIGCAGFARCIETFPGRYRTVTTTTSRSSPSGWHLSPLAPCPAHITMTIVHIVLVKVCRVVSLCCACWASLLRSTAQGLSLIFAPACRSVCHF